MALHIFLPLWQSLPTRLKSGYRTVGFLLYQQQLSLWRKLFQDSQILKEKRQQYEIQGLAI